MTDANYVNTQLLIDGVWSDAQSGKTIDVLNPATGLVIGQVAHADIADLDRALAALQRGFDVWRWVPANERAQIMRKAAQLVRERAEGIAQLLTLEQGKPIAESRVEVNSAADTVGPVAAFTPWNFPVNQVVRKLCAALATGCSFLVKAPEETPASPAALLRAFVDAGVPPGVVGLVFGDPAQISSYLIAHPVVVGKHLAALAGQHMKRATMELGGHAPVIIAEDADVEAAVKAMAGAKFRNAGQVCISPTRFLVHNSIREEFTREMVRYAESLKVGNGLDADTTLGALAR